MEEVFLRGQFTFYRSFYEAIRNIRNNTKRAETYDMLCEYALNCVEPDTKKLTALQKNTLGLIFPVLDSARKKAIGGTKHGKDHKNASKKWEDWEAQKEDTGKIPGRYREDAGNKGEKEIDIEIEKDIEIDIETETKGYSLAEGRGGGFDIFWNYFPKKVCKEQARAVFSKTDVPLEVLLQAIREQQQSFQWTKEGGRYIPNPATWLQERRWEDQLPTGLVHASGIQPSGVLGQAERDAIARIMSQE